MERREHPQSIPATQSEQVSAASAESNGSLTRLAPEDLARDAQIRILDGVVVNLPFRSDTPDEFFHRMMQRPDMREILEALAK